MNVSFNRRDLFRFAGIAAAFSFPSLSTKGVMTSPSPLAYGKLPATPEAVALKLKDYITSPIWIPSGNFGHYSLVNNWQMLGNDTVGCCAIAQPYHGIMLWEAMADRAVNINTQCTLSSYSLITGWNPHNPESDRGSNMVTVADYWQNSGLKDADGDVHKIDGYVGLQVGNWQELITATYLFNAVGIGVAMPYQWELAFRNGQAWDAVADPSIVGGHAIMSCGHVNDTVPVVTWGRTQTLTQAGYEQFSDEALVYLSEDMFADISAKDIDGLDWQTLRQDMRDLNSEAPAAWADDGGK